jgi:thermostable 8-oxoguanine DNA glycosylase
MPGTVQNMMALLGGELRTLELPPSDQEVMRGVRWGAFDEFLTPAFWAGRVWLHSTDPSFSHHRLGRTLEEELAACLLGGYGIPAEVGLAAFRDVRDSGLLQAAPSPGDLMEILAKPLTVDGRQVHYRFARQKSNYLSAALRDLRRAQLPSEDRAFRDALTELPGIGMKTASWITRNMKDSDSVAILDIHICRACSTIGVFPEQAEPSKSYRPLEELFLAFASALSARASILDGVMWYVMRRIGSSVVSKGRRAAAPAAA